MVMNMRFLVVHRRGKFNYVIIFRTSNKTFFMSFVSLQHDSRYVFFLVLIEDHYFPWL